MDNLFFIMKPDGAQLATVTGLIEQKKATAVVDSVWTFEEFGEAFERVDGGHAGCC